MLLKAKHLPILFILSLLFIALCLNLGLVPYQLEEPRRVMIAFEMMKANNLIVPLELGEYYYKKPPVYNWILMAFHSVFGESEFVSRMANNFIYLSWAFALFYIIKDWLGKKTALLSAVFVFTSVELLFYFSLLAEVDIFYGFITSIGMLLFLKHRENNSLKAFLALYILNAIGVLTKGLPSFIFAGGSVILLAVYKRSWKLLFHKHHFIGIGSFVLILTTYFGLYSLFNSPLGFIEDFWSQSKYRTVLAEADHNFWLHLWQFPLHFILSMTPGSLFLLLLLKKPGKLKSFIAKERGLLLFFFLLHFLIYWFSPGSALRYVYMLMPFWLIPIADFTVKESQALQNERLKKLVIFAAALISIIFSIVIYFTENDCEIDLLIAVAFAMGFAAGSYFLLLKKNLIWSLLACMLFLRITFNYHVLPIRAEQGHVAENYQHAEHILEKINNEPIYLWEKCRAATFSLATGYYIERGIDTALTFTANPYEKGYIIAEPQHVGELPTAEVVYKFTNRHIPFVLLHNK